jgi:hypothetical protein
MGRGASSFVSQPSGPYVPRAFRSVAIARNGNLRARGGNTKAQFRIRAQPRSGLARRRVAIAGRCDAMERDAGRSQCTNGSPEFYEIAAENLIPIGTIAACHENPEAIIDQRDCGAFRHAYSIGTNKARMGERCGRSVNRSARSLSLVSLWRLALPGRGGGGSALTARVFHLFLTARSAGRRRSLSRLRSTRPAQKRHPNSRQAFLRQFIFVHSQAVQDSPAAWLDPNT